MRQTPILAIIAILLTGCVHVPQEAVITDKLPSIFPDNIGITVPINIAPTNFLIQDEANKYITLLEAGSTQIKICGKKVQIPIQKWRKLTTSGHIAVTVYQKIEGKWNKFKPFTIYVSNDAIDSYLSYRLIPYSFESYQRLSINQRDLTSFKEKVVYANDMVMEDNNRQCINCHYFKNYKTDYMQFHARQHLGGTIFFKNGELLRLNMSTDSTLASAVYPAWHPTHNYIAYSTNKTYQNMHTINPDRIEVFDEASDLILYNINDNAISIIENSPNLLECYPTWSGDGQTLYYTAATSPNLNSQTEIASHIQEIKYNLYSKKFDPESRTWGSSSMIIDAAAQDSSITWPRVSPDGRYLLCCISTHGVFTIHHSQSDLMIYDLVNGIYRYASELNSQYSESYHAWSSTSKWVVLTTRREDGLYTRLYLAHCDLDGGFSKPFALPQQDPEFNKKFLYAFNTPEFSIEPIELSARKIASFIKNSKPTQVSFQAQKTQQ